MIVVGREKRSLTVTNDNERAHAKSVAEVMRAGKGRVRLDRVPTVGDEHSACAVAGPLASQEDRQRSNLFGLGHVP